MKIGGRTWMSIGLMAISAGVFLTALKWPFKTAVFPMTIALFVFVLAALEVFLGLFMKKNAKETSTMDFKPAGAEEANIDEATARKRIIGISLWIGGFFLLILLLGFPLAVPVYFILFLKLYGKESWPVTLVLSGIAWGCFYGLFIRLLHIPFADGWVQLGLQWLGILS